MGDQVWPRADDLYLCFREYILYSISLYIYTVCHRMRDGRYAYGMCRTFRVINFVDMFVYSSQ